MLQARKRNVCNWRARNDDEEEEEEKGGEEEQRQEGVMAQSGESGDLTRGAKQHSI
jgi:hypothetical protein